MTQHESIPYDDDDDETVTWNTMASSSPADITQLHTVYHQEFSKYRTCDYIPRLQDEYRQGSEGMEGAINPQWREKICEWKYQGTKLMVTLWTIIILLQLAFSTVDW